MLGKKFRESKKRTHFSRAKAIKKDDERSYRCTRKKLSKSCSRDQYQRKGVQKREVKVNDNIKTFIKIKYCEKNDEKKTIFKIKHSRSQYFQVV